MCRLSAQRDTLARYQMGEVERINGLSYGSRHILVLFTDSTFSYSTKKAMQISTSEEEAATGKWAVKNDTLILTGTGKSSMPKGFLSSGYRDTRKNLLIWFNFFDCTPCSELSPLILYSGSSTRTIFLSLQPVPLSENELKLRSPVQGVRAELEVDLPVLDSLRLGGMTFYPEEKQDNEISVSFHPAFRVKMVKTGNSLQVVGRNQPVIYRFEKR
jgi:hypothetical protein